MVLFMGNKNIIVIFLFSIILFDCTAQQHKKKSKTKLKQGFIEMKKTVCYGRCPVYSIKITSEGKAIYYGEKNVDKVGHYEKILTTEQTKELFDAFNKTDFWKFQEEYKGKVTDVPSTIITYNYDGKSKTVTAQWDAPEEFKNLASLVEKVVDLEGWNKIEIRNN